MSDFLTRLIQRVQGTDSTVRPLVGSRFGPGPRLAGGPKYLEAEPGGDLDTGPAANVDRHGPSADRPAVPPSPEGTSFYASSAGSRTLLFAEGSLPGPTLQRSLAPGEPATPGTPYPLLSAPDPAAPGPAAGRGQNAVLPVPPAPLFPALNEPPRAQNAPGRFSPPGEAPKSERKAQPLLVPQPRTFAQPPDRHTSRAGRDIEERLEAVKPQAIHVTIGRIDVRAVLPPSPEPRPVAVQSGPPLSLDEYLRQRKGRAG